MIGCLFFALSAGNVSGALPVERPGAFAMVIDVPIRILGIGLAVVIFLLFLLNRLLKYQPFQDDPCWLS
ncbi:MAG: hypothetical protein CL909_09450, partial [Deltaproteobacteria bacterium]|nr:hypothetical protein [Deltaproteobacteria bacterium]